MLRRGQHRAVVGLVEPLQRGRLVLQHPGGQLGHFSLHSKPEISPPTNKLGNYFSLSVQVFRQIRLVEEHHKQEKQIHLEMSLFSTKNVFQLRMVLAEKTFLSYFILWTLRSIFDD